MELFDLGIFYAQKPNFFLGDNPTYLLDENHHINQGININHNKELSDEVFELISNQKQLLNGNYLILEKYFSKKLNKEDVRLIKIGDHYLSDNIAVTEHKNWGALNISCQLDDNDLYLIPKDFGKKWGEAVFVTQEGDISFVSQILKAHNILSLPNVTYLSYFN